MTIPVELETASADFRRFIEDVKLRIGHPTTNMAWGTLLGVFEVFRRRLTLSQSIEFAQALPPLLRAVFVMDLHQREPLAFADRATLAAEVQGVHRDHQFASETAIADVSAALRAHVDAQAFDRVLSRLPPEACEFWQP